MKNKKIAIIGHFGGKGNFLDGQTVKTKVLHDELTKKTQWKIRKVDTYYYRHNPLKLLWQLMGALLTTRDVILLVSGNGMRVFFPLLSTSARLLGTRVYHSLIGANLDRYIQKYPAYVKYLNAFTVNWVEMQSLKKRLETAGLNNVEVMPNFKRLHVVEPEEMTYSEQMPYKLCTFSRVMKEKGIEDAIHAVDEANKQLGKKAYTLDIYGQVDAAQTQWFEELQQNLPAGVSYKGQVHFSQSTQVLKDYFALLFPTRFFTEGVPGTIVDAYAAGIPVIASRWEGFADVVEHEVTGYGYAFEAVDALTALLVQFAEHPEKLNGLKDNCIAKAQYYMPEKSVERIVRRMETEAKKK